uniref:Translation initiation factor IF-1, chloroplastic n=1 Tax=Hepatica nobilis var. japonica TaxID=231669 RepID=A0A7L8Y918_HEPNO|nr:plastid translation initiation factor 1 [Hepatica nobilis var. japonica]
MALTMTTMSSAINPSSTRTLNCLPPPSPTTTWLRTTNTTPPLCNYALSISTISNNTSRKVIVCNSKGPSSGMKEQKMIHEGLIVESLPNGMFRVRLDNEDVILGYISGRIRKSFVRVLPGDRVRVEVSRYDSSKGRITYRLRTSKDPSS